jgi:hypothetical protein
MGGKCSPSGGTDVIVSDTQTRIPRGPGRPNSRVNLFDRLMRLITSRWYDANGNELHDRDYTDHGFPDQHPEVPHDHPYTIGRDGQTQRQSRPQTPNGSC